MNGPRPKQLLLVAGTGTEVGKTYVGCQLLQAARQRGLRVAARKPAQSFAPEDPPASTDAALLAAASAETPHQVCPPGRWYPLALAPPMAAAALSLAPPLLGELLDELHWPADLDLGLVELAGGLRAPQTQDADGVAFCAALAPDAVLLIADAGLGTLNLVRLSLDVLRHPRVLVYLNRYQHDEQVHRLNLAWLQQQDQLQVATEISQVLAWLGY